MSFAHLHVHTEFSLGSSLVKTSQLIQKVRELEMPAVAITDWNNLYGTLHFQKALKKYGESKVKGLYGVELGVKVPHSGPFLRHVVLLAQNNEGFASLQHLVSRAHTEFGYSEIETLQPYIPLELLLKHSENLILLSGGMKGILNSFLLQDQDKPARELMEQLKGAYQDRFYLELQHSGFSVLEQAQEKLQNWADDLKIPSVATCDVHYIDPDDAFAHEVWMMVSQKLSLENNPRSGLMSQEFHLKAPDEMRILYNENSEAIENSLKIADRCHVDFDFTDKEGNRVYFLPSFQEKGKNEADIFHDNSWEGLKFRLEKNKITDPETVKIYEDRLKYELEVIGNMGFAGYYLIVSDFIRWAKRNEIPVGPGRGSGAGSLVAYSLDIIDLDPIENKLVFERFLNPERVSLPDFDIDFCQARRSEVIEYVSEKYGKEQVCQIVTFAKEQSKNALKDVGRVLGMSFAETNRLTKLIPSVQAKPLTISETLEEVAEFKDIYQSDPKVKQVTDLALKIEGGLRQPGVHAAGVIIASQPIEELAPVSRDVNGNPITQWDMKMSEEAGLVKFDFLGLVTLDLLDLACRLVRQREDQQDKEALKYDNVPIDDPRAYQLISEGDTLGVFQLESTGMQNLCTRIEPGCLDDVAAINALYRPGPLESGMVDDFVNRKHGRAKVEVIFPEMNEILKESYGVILYQEQVMELARQISGYTLGGADLLRRAMGKKIAEEMESQRSLFVGGAEKDGKDPVKAAELFDLIAKFAGYGFNKSHASAYGKLAVQTAFLKAVYPTEFFTALLTIEKENTDKMARYIVDAKKRNLNILPPDINESLSDFTNVAEGEIRFGLSAIKNVGEAAVESIIAAKKTVGRFTDLFQFLSNVDTRKINKRVLESLIQAGALDSLEEGVSPDVLRAKYLASAEKALEWAAKEAATKSSGQFSLFGEELEDTKKFQPTYDRGTLPTQRAMLDWEKQLLGIYLSGSPLDKYEDKIKQLACDPIYLLKDKPSGAEVILAGMITELRELKIKRGRRAGDMMAVFKVEDLTGQVEMVSFPDHFEEFKELYRSGDPLLVRAKLEFEESKPKLLGGDVKIKGEYSVQSLEDIEESYPKRVSVRLALSRLSQHVSSEFVFGEIQKTLRKYPGPVPVELLLFKRGNFQTRLDLSKDFSVMPHKNLLEDLKSIVSIPGCLEAESVL